MMNQARTHKLVRELRKHVDKDVATRVASHEDVKEFCNRWTEAIRDEKKRLGLDYKSGPLLHPAMELPSRYLIGAYYVFIDVRGWELESYWATVMKKNGDIYPCYSDGDYKLSLWSGNIFDKYKGMALTGMHGILGKEASL